MLPVIGLLTFLSSDSRTELHSIYIQLLIASIYYNRTNDVAGWLATDSYNG